VNELSARLQDVQPEGTGPKGALRFTSPDPKDALEAADSEGALEVPSVNARSVPLAVADLSVAMCLRPQRALHHHGSLEEIGLLAESVGKVWLPKASP